jgi:hypothetical protein
VLYTYLNLRRGPLRKRTLGPVRISSEVLGTVPFTNPAEGSGDGMHTDAATPLDPDGA